MYYLIAQSFPSHQQKMLDRCEKKDDITGMLAIYLRKTKGQLVQTMYEMLNEGVHIIEEPNHVYKIYQTRNVGWVKNNFYHDHVLTYSIVEYLEPSIKVAFPPCKALSDVLLSGKADFNDDDIFF